MALPSLKICRAGLLLTLVMACRERDAQGGKGSSASLPPVFSLAPAGNANWDASAGSFMLVAENDLGDSAAVVLPEATDSTMHALSSYGPQISNAVFDLYGRSGKIGTSSVQSFEKPSGNGSCNAWPAARLRTPHSGWQVALTNGSAQAIPLDSIETLSSADSASLAASLTESVAILPIASDATFRRLPFRVLYAYTTDSDSIEVVAADVVRALNEEANPRVEHIFVIGERPKATKGRYSVAYYDRTAGAEESTQAVEVLAALEIGSSRRRAFVVNVESEEGARFGLVEQTAPAEWRVVWWSAYTTC